MKSPSALLPSKLLEKLHTNKKLDRHLKSYLAQPLWSRVAIAGLEKGGLTLLVANQTLATTLRYQQTGLIEHFNADEALDVQFILIKVSASLNDLAT